MTNPATVPQIIALAERLGDATSLDPLSWCPRTDSEGTLYTADGEAAATPGEITATWAWLLSPERHLDQAAIQATGVYLGGAMVDLLADDGGELTTLPVRDLNAADRDRALASLIVTAAALRRRLHETAGAITAIVADNATDQLDKDDR